MYFDFFGGEYSRTATIGLGVAKEWEKQIISYIPAQEAVNIESKTPNGQSSLTLKCGSLNELRDLLQECLNVLPSRNDVALAEEIARREAAIAVATTEAAAAGEEGA